MTDFVSEMIRIMKQKWLTYTIYCKWEETKQAILMDPIQREVRKAVLLTPSNLHEPAQDPILGGSLKQIDDTDAPLSDQLFSQDGNLLPCWRQTDLVLIDDWLTDPMYYPVYFQLFRKLCELLQVSSKKQITMLEIGTRTGYIGVVFAKAMQRNCSYFGLDPNLAVKEGLQYASDSFKIIREKIENFTFALWEGYSWDVRVQRSLLLNSPFDIIHIDGEHTKIGKLIDLKLASRLIIESGFVLVDDYDFIPFIRESVKRAMAMQWFSKFAYLATKRGLAVLQV